MLLHGRIDVLACDLGIVNNLIREDLQLQADYAQPILVNQLDLRLMMNKHSRYIGRFAEIEQILQEMKDEGVIADIVFSYLY
ncbi:MAG: hypothetical protein GY951_14480 [Psychromonas sp.]|nr:hypothetical protein [Alteromonadales bacterium]MCP5079247.1 hypothetical protein [Psychromonas sp.]